jgi:hypothetical protein
LEAADVTVHQLARELARATPELDRLARGLLDHWIELVSRVATERRLGVAV